VRQWWKHAKERRERSCQDW